MADIDSKYQAAVQDYWTSDDKDAFVNALVSLQGLAKQAALLHWEFYLKGRIAHAKGDYAQALGAYDGLLASFGRDAVGDVAVVVARGLGNKGAALLQFGRPYDAVAVCDDVVLRFGEATDVRLQLAVARALVNKASALTDTARLEEVPAVCDEVLARFGGTEEARLMEEVALALIVNGVCLTRLGRLQDAIAAYDEVAARLPDPAEAPLRQAVAMALVNKGMPLVLLGRFQDAIAVYDDVVARFGDAEERRLREVGAKGLVNKGSVLGRLGRFEDAIAIYDDVVSRFRDIQERPFREQVARALANKGVILGRLGKDQEAQKGLTQAREISPEITDKAALEGYIRDMADDVSDFKQSIQERDDRTGEFLSQDSNFPDTPDDKPEALLFFLREWNSYTPIIPNEAEDDRGGGYFIRYRTQGIVIDPGHDFIELFCVARGRLVDIDHIILSHAHTDHTAEVEALFTLLYEYNERHPDAPKKVSLYLSQDANTKFSGLLGLWTKNISRTTVLNPALVTTSSQTVGICEGASLTVLPAEHADPITQGKAVGLGLDFKFGAKKKRIVFTCDTGYLRNGEPISQEYPKDFHKPDLLVAHLGSIHPREFEFVEARKSGDTAGDYRDSVYPNHLGLFGTCLMIRSLSPSCAVISEFGEELKDIRIQLVAAVAQVVQDVCPVLCGDPTMVYRISDGKFLCHQTCDFEAVGDLEIETHRPATGHHKPYLVKRDRHLAGDVQDWCEKYHERLKECYLPYFATGAWPGVV